MEIYIGIDPGVTGAMATISSNGVSVFDFDDGETLERLRIVGSLPEKTVAVIEKVHSMPKQGVASSFKFGQNFGQWIGRLETLRIRFDFVTPQKWQKEIFDSMAKGDRKSMSLDRARRLFPEMAEYLKRKKDHSRADAILIAEYCRRTAQ